MSGGAGVIVEIVKMTLAQWQEDKVSRLAAAMAFFAVLSIPSLLTLVITIAGQVVGEQGARQLILGEAGTLIGPQAVNALQTILETTERPQELTVATIVSIAVLFFSASGVLVQLQDALETIWGVRPDPERGIVGTIKQRGFSFLLIVFIGILVLALLLVNTLVSGLGQSLNDLLPVAFSWVRLLTTLASFIIYTLLIMAIFKVIPDAQVAWRDVSVGALVTALLLSAGIIGLDLYFKYNDPTSSYGAAGSFLALLIWIYYSAQILFLGAEFTQVYARKFGDRIRPDEINEAQRREIKEMEWLIEDIKDNGVAETEEEADARPVPSFSETLE